MSSFYQNAERPLWCQDSNQICKINVNTCQTGGSRSCYPKWRLRPIQPTTSNRVGTWWRPRPSELRWRSNMPAGVSRGLSSGCRSFQQPPGSTLLGQGWCSPLVCCTLWTLPFKAKIFNSSIINWYELLARKMTPLVKLTLNRDTQTQRATSEMTWSANHEWPKIYSCRILV